MSLTEVLAELPSLTPAERQWLVRRALELDEPGLPAEDTALVERRLAEHHRDPSTSLPLDEVKARLRSRSKP